MVDESGEATTTDVGKQACGWRKDWQDHHYDVAE